MFRKGLVRVGKKGDVLKGGNFNFVNLLDFVWNVLSLMWKYFWIFGNAFGEVSFSCMFLYFEEGNDDGDAGKLSDPAQPHSHMQKQLTHATWLGIFFCTTVM